MNTDTLLIEIGTEELPPTALKTLSTAFENNLNQELNNAKFEFESIESFATPRRLSVQIKGICEQQPDQHVERFGPAVAAAYDESGNPSKAAQGFARSCGVEIDALETKNDGKLDKLFYAFTQKGESLEALLQGFIENALAKLPIPKRMRWGNHDYQFIRPMQWLVVLLGERVLPITIMGHQAGNLSRGHRFHCSEPVEIEHADRYADTLREQGHVEVSFETRLEKIKHAVQACASQAGGTAVMPNSLLEEVTALVEWPVAVMGGFEARFLEVPKEALIATMQYNQKYFAILDDNGHLLPHFITISNIESKQEQEVVSGNERVIRPRFADAEFFFQQDLKTPLEQNNERLKNIVFQESLGTVFDKVERLQSLAAYLAEQINANSEDAKRAAELSKADLVSEMVNEFSSMQGIAGKYYASHAGEARDIPLAIEEQYKPKFASDTLPSSSTGQALSLAEKLDTLIGIWAVGLKPTGSKDPYALRRAALGVLRILIEKELPINLHNALTFAAQQYPDTVKALDFVDEVHQFCFDRLRAYCGDLGYTPQQFEAVLHSNTPSPLDFMLRIKAIQSFSSTHEAESLSSANKRIANILSKADGLNVPNQVGSGILKESQEQQLFDLIRAQSPSIKQSIDTQNYNEAMLLLAKFKEPVDDFFEHVMVMAEDESLKLNRIALLKALRELFLGVADISALQG